MELQSAICDRRSHRQFTGKEIARKTMTEILASGLFAPSPKNRQPWYFVSCGPKTKNQILTVLKDKLAAMIAESKNPGSLSVSMRAIEESAEFILVYNPYATSEADYNPNRWKADILSIGACIQNMLLTAHNKDIQTLWICDILFAEAEIGRLLGIEDELVAGVIFGEGSRKEIPQRPRTGLDDKLIQTA